MIQYGKEFIKHITKDDCIKEVVDFSCLSQAKGIEIFIICQDSFKYKNVDIHKFVKKLYTKEQIQYIIQNGIRFVFTFNEIISLNKNKKDFYIVDNSFPSKFGINNISSNIFYYINNSKKFLYFMNESKLLMIESGNRLSLTPSINDNKIHNEALNTNEFDQNNNNNIIINNNNEFCSVKKINNNIIGKNNPNCNVDNNLNYFNLVNNINTTNEININNNTGSNDTKTNILNALILIYASDKEYSRIIKNNLPEKYDLKHFCLINKEWMNQFANKFRYDKIRDILSNYFQYNSFNEYIQNLKSIRSNEYFRSIISTIQAIQEIPDSFWLQINLIPKIIYDQQNYYYSWPVNCSFIHEYVFNIFKKFTLENENEINEYKIIIGNSTIYLQSKQNQCIVYAYIFINNNMILLAIITYLQNTYFQAHFDGHLKQKSLVQYLQEKNFYDFNKINITQDILGTNGSNLGEIILKYQIRPNNETNNIDLSSISQNFIQLKNNLFQIPDLNIDLPDINTIYSYLTRKILQIISVIIIETKKLKYCLENIKNKNLNNLLNYTQSIEIVSYDKITDFNQYSFVNVNFCRNLKIKYENRDIACYFVNKTERFIYFFNQKKLLKVTNYNDNTFYLSKLVLEPPIPKKLARSKGLENIGGPCYMNATIQCLSNVTSLRNYFKNKKRMQKDAQGRSSPMAEALYELINNLWENDQKYYAPHKFKDLISQMNPLFRGIQANDSKDLIIFIYETLHKELNNPNSNSIKLTNINNYNDMHEELKELRQNYYSKNKSIITKIFYSEIMNNIQCCTCKFNKASFNIISFLIFPLEKVRLYLEKKKPLGFPSVTLEDCFEQNEEKETFTGSNQIYCNNCFNNSDALSYNRLYNCPEVLTIILNRGKGLEFNVEFEFPYNINIEKYVIDKSCNTNYELIGVITHLGPSGMSGHFIAYCKSPSDKNWYRYNDSQVTPCVDAKSEINSNGIPYVLYYQRCNIENEKVVEEDPSDNFLDTNTITLYFTYNDKEVYLEVNKNKYFSQVKEELCEKYKSIPPGSINYFKMQEMKMLNIEMNKTVEENNLKNGDKICIII